MLEDQDNESSGAARAAQNVQQWPAAGGATASIRFSPEIDHAANAGLKGALSLLDPINQKYPDVSYADLYQMASAIAIEVSREQWHRLCIWPWMQNIAGPWLSRSTRSSCLMSASCGLPAAS